MNNEFEKNFSAEGAEENSVMDFVEDAENINTGESLSEDTQAENLFEGKGAEFNVTHSTVKKEKRVLQHIHGLTLLW